MSLVSDYVMEVLKINASWKIYNLDIASILHGGFLVEYEPLR